MLNGIFGNLQIDWFYGGKYISGWEQSTDSVHLYKMFPILKLETVLNID